MRSLTPIKNIFVVMLLGSLVACSNSNNNNSAVLDTVKDPVTPTWSVEAGEDQSVVSDSLVALEGSTTLSADNTDSIEWLQLTGPDVSITDGNQLSASFTAPSVEGDTDLSLQLSITDVSGLVKSDQLIVTVTALPALSIEGISPDFGLPGTAITLELSGVSESPVVELNGMQIVPTDVGDESDTLTFVVPEGAKSGPLRVTSGDRKSNIVYLPVSDIGVLAPDDDEIVLDELGNRVAVGHILVSLIDEDDSEEEAERLAEIVSGQMVGRIPLLNGWQIKLNTTTLEELRAVADTLEMEASVDFTVIDVESEPDAINWSDDPDRPSQRLRNRVEQGVSLYESKVHPTSADKVRPFFMAIGVSELGVDFTHPDFSDYTAGGAGESGNVSIYALQKSRTSIIFSRSAKHGSNVTGIIAAELGDKGNAGPIRALSGSHGGANISVGTKTWAFSSDRLAKTNQQLEAGSRVVNWSWGWHLEGTLNCSNNPVSKEDNNLGAREFVRTKRSVEKFFRKLAEDYPQALIVSSAGNDATDTGNLDTRIPSSVKTDQQIVVGAHTSGGTAAAGLTEDDYAETSPTACFDTAIDTDVKRAQYSNYGERVDIAASGSVMGLTNDAHANGNWGTSFATPLVTATIALMQSINPNLTPAEIKHLLRSSALPIENKVVLASGGETVFTKPLLASESSEYAGKGARLNMEGAIQAALNSLADETVTIAAPVTVSLPRAFPGSASQTISLTIPGDQPIFDKVDIMFVVDISASYEDDLAVFREKANDLIDAFSNAGSDVAIGLSSFSDFSNSPFGDSGDFAFNLDQPLTTELLTVKSKLDLLTIRSGGDGPESQLEAMYQTAQASTGWRAGALPVLFLATDASFHNSDDEPGYPGRGYTATVAALEARSARVFGLQSGGPIADVLQITEATGGQALQLSRDSAEIVEKVVEALESTASDISVQLEPYGDFAGLVGPITPRTITGVNAGDKVEFDVLFINNGSFDSGTTQTFSFRLRLVAEGIAVIQEVPVTVVIN